MQALVGAVLRFLQIISVPQEPAGSPAVRGWDQMT